MHDLVTALRSGKVLLMDGAMGTEIARLTRSASVACGESYNLSAPELIRSIHRAYLDAGADVLLTNTFQANPCVVKQFGVIWNAALRLARFGAARPHFVLADVGPIDNFSDEIAAEILAECVNVDGVLLETWTSLDALKRCAALAQLPLLVSFTFQRTDDLRTSAGARPEDCARAAKEYGAVALGANCGKEIGMIDLVEIVRRYRSACDLPIFVRPNAGTPVRSGTGWDYPRSPDNLAGELPALLQEGIAMIGGCCGTTPETIQRFRGVVDAWEAAR